MVRILAILVLIASGLPGLGAGFAADQDHRGETSCKMTAPEMSCCGKPSPGADAEFCCGSEAYCPMSEGPCQCGISPTPAPERLPEAPLPRTDRESFNALPSGPPKIMPVIEPDDATPSMASLFIGLRAGRTHNEVRALLCVWQT